MTNEELRKVQIVQSKMLEDIARVCDENDIKYFLYGGTLLGAVRHKGFIPWDDDLDICMLREDYDKFLLLANGGLSDRLAIREMHSDESFGLPFTKICLKGTLYIEKEGTNDIKSGIFVDIMPLDFVNVEKIQKATTCLKLNLFKKMLLVKSGYNTGGGFLKRCVYSSIKIFAMMFSRNKIISNLDACVKNMSCDKSDKLWNLLFPDNNYFKFNKLYNASWFLESTNLEFEKKFYNAPKHFEENLEFNYGDYMKLPPENERGNIHGIVKLEFGMYNKIDEEMKL